MMEPAEKTQRESHARIGQGSRRKRAKEPSHWEQHKKALRKVHRKAEQLQESLRQLESLLGDPGVPLEP